MKKLISIAFFLTTFIIAGCTKNDNNDNNVETGPYSEKQIKALAIFNGTWENIWQVYDTRIIFTAQYDTPVEFKEGDYMLGEKVVFTAHGECEYEVGGYNTIALYYYVTSDADALWLAYRGGEKDKEVYEMWDMEIESETEVVFNNNPYSTYKKL